MGKRLPVLLLLVISILCTACNTRGDITDISMENNDIFDAEDTVLLPDLTQELLEQTLPKSVVSVIEAYDAWDYTGIWHRCPGMPSGWADVWNFNEDGTFIFLNNQMDAASREIALAGKWEVDSWQENLILTY